jgi:tetratricopeptide (TPR) repeat protein
LTQAADQPGRIVTPYEQGVVHLKRSENAEAVAAFTEAVRLDPNSANAYVGRALAYRSLEDDAAAVLDETTAKALGGPERSAWDRLVKRGYRHWRGDLGDPAWSRDDPLTRDAVLLRQWTWQIYNGGLPQWVANGYGQWTADLASTCDRVGTDAARAVAAIVRDVERFLHASPDARDVMFRMIANRTSPGGREDQIFLFLSGHEGVYGRVAQTFGLDVESWFERQGGKL